MSFYDGKNLENWLSTISYDQFPYGRDYYGQYKHIKDWISDNIYKEITAAALLAAADQQEELIYLNNHGKEHVDCVICRATDLIKESCDIDAYQIYILLVAILIHDAGNIYGRNNHELRCMDIMNRLGGIAGEESAEKRIILKVAQAHGGYANGNKDTIGILEPGELYGRTVSQRLLAAILRFADELADDVSRASRFMVEGHLLNKGSEIFHAYSYSLKSVQIKDRAIRLLYELTRENIKNPLQAGKTKRYLIDEIFRRVIKMHLENRYCSRYINTDAKCPIADRISVRIDMYEGYSADTMVRTIADPIEFTVEEKGYPVTPENGIYDLCPELKDVNGESLRKKIDAKR